MSVLTGLDRSVADGFTALQGLTLGVVANQATVDAACIHLIDRLLPGHRAGAFHIGAVFGPQHGIWGHTQDNMIEWEGYPDPRTGLRFHSLYGQHREPTEAMLEGLDRLVIDVPDIGSRYYTFAWTMALCVRAAAARGLPVTILDRPNPLDGVSVEGSWIQPGFESFVGQYPMAIRHGLTLGELAHWVNDHHLDGQADLTVVPCSGWDRRAYHDQTGLPWVMPSPNMPTLETALVYPGQCLLEGTRLSEGRGTTRPFELFGAPYLDAWEIADAVNAVRLPGVFFRPVIFEPTFQKHAQIPCQGAQIHVTDRASFRPVLTTIAVLQAVWRLAPNDARWLDPPYEYVWDRMPIDILAGNEWIRHAIEDQTDIAVIRDRMADEIVGFAGQRWDALRYP